MPLETTIGTQTLTYHSELDLIYFYWSGWEFRINHSDKLFIGQIGESEDFDRYLRKEGLA